MMYGVTFPMSEQAMSNDFLLPIGKAKVELEGSDVTIVAHSKMVTHSLEAAQDLLRQLLEDKWAAGLAASTAAAA